MDLRALLDAVATGDAGFDRLGFEIRLHAQTVARLKNTTLKNSNLQRMYIEEQGKTEERKNQADGWKKLYRIEKRKRTIWKCVGIGSIGYIVYDAVR